MTESLWKRIWKIINKTGAQSIKSNYEGPLPTPLKKAGYSGGILWSSAGNVDVAFWVLTGFPDLVVNPGPVDGTWKTHSKLSLAYTCTYEYT